MSEHDFDAATGFCLGCGKGRASEFERPAPCPAAPNVIAISHIVLGRRLEVLLARAFDWDYLRDG